MEFIIVAGAITTALAGFGVLAGWFGFDSRESVDQDPSRTYTVRFI